MSIKLMYNDDHDGRSNLTKVVIMAMISATFVISLVSLSYNAEAQTFGNNIIGFKLLPELFSKIKQPLIEVQASNTTKVEDILTYQNSSYGIRIQYPAKWTKSEQDRDPNDNVTDIIAFSSPLRSRSDNFSETLAISMERFSNQSMNLKEYATSLVTDYNKTLTDFKLLDLNTNSTLGGGAKRAYGLIYTDREDNTKYKTMEIGTIIGDRIYYIEYIAEEKQYSKYLPTIQMMINSLQIT